MTRSKYSTTDVWPPDHFGPLLIEMGRLVFNWNSLERILVQILNLLTGTFPKNQVVTAHMGTSAICDAMKTVANEFHKDDEQKHILHCVSIFETLRDYRNYYVHGFCHILYVPGGEPKAGFYSKSARSRLVVHRMENDVADIKEVAFQCKEASHYLALVHNYFYYNDKPEYEKLPSLHPLPPKFLKPKAFLLDSDG